MPRYKNKEWGEKRFIGLGQRNLVGHVSIGTHMFKVAENKNVRRPYFIKI
jgi:hypothetical protein